MSDPAPDSRAAGGDIWSTLGYRFVPGSEGRLTIEWDATLDFCFPDTGRTIVHGGMLATLLDSAMGHACAAALGEDESFLTADLHVEFYRSAVPGTLRAEADVVHQSKRAMFCTASLYDAAGTLLASARCTQIVRRQSA
jgi:uncharacterized protein (TIGR00369 family)